MTAPADQNAFDLSTGDTWPYTLTVWRGVMIDRFSRCEALVLKCLLRLQASGIELPADAFADGAATRLRRLRECLEQNDLGGRSKAAKRVLSVFAELAEHRAGIAHGSIRRHGNGILIEWTCCRGEIVTRSRWLSQADVLRELHALEKTWRDLSSEIGQVCKAIDELPA